MGRHDRVAGVDAPAVVVEIQHRLLAQQVHVGLPQALDGAHVPPVPFEGVGHHDFAVVQHGGDDVLAEVVAGIGIGVVLLHVVPQLLPVEDVDAHGREVALGLLGLLLEGLDDAVGVGVHDAEAMGLRPGHLQHRDGGRRLLFAVEVQHLGVVHLIDMVTGEDEHIVRVVLVHELPVLPDGVGGAAVPVAVLALGHVGGQHEDAAVVAVEIPVLAGAQIRVEGQGAVLGQHAHRVEAGVDAVAEGEIDDPILAAEGDGRLGHVGGEYAQSAALAAG